MTRETEMTEAEKLELARLEARRDIADGETIRRLDWLRVKANHTKAGTNRFSR